MKCSIISLAILTNRLISAALTYDSHIVPRARNSDDFLVRLLRRGPVRAQTVREEGRGLKGKVNGQKSPWRSLSSGSLSTGNSALNISPIRSTRTEEFSSLESLTTDSQSSSGSFLRISPIRSTRAEAGSTPSSPTPNSQGSRRSSPYPSPIRSTRAEHGYSPGSSRSSSRLSGPPSPYGSITARNTRSERNSLSNDPQYITSPKTPDHTSQASDTTLSSPPSPQRMRSRSRPLWLHDSPMSMAGDRPGDQWLNSLRRSSIGPGSSSAESVYPRD